MERCAIVPGPPESLLNELTPINFDHEAPWAQIIDGRVRTVTSTIDQVESEVLDVIGAQMDQLSDTFQETIKATRDLFAALVKLNATQSAIVEAKRAAATDLLMKLETAMEFNRKV
jgi:hypothetical protein